MMYDGIKLDKLCKIKYNKTILCIGGVNLNFLATLTVTSVWHIVHYSTPNYKEEKLWKKLLH